jgi:hypothetical protein
VSAAVLDGVCGREMASVTEFLGSAVRKLLEAGSVCVQLSSLSGSAVLWNLNWHVHLILRYRKREIIVCPCLHDAVPRQINSLWRMKKLASSFCLLQTRSA